MIRKYEINHVTPQDMQMLRRKSLARFRFHFLLHIKNTNFQSQFPLELGHSPINYMIFYYTSNFYEISFNELFNLELHYVLKYLQL